MIVEDFIYQLLNSVWFYVFWYLSGVAGCLLLWLDWAREFDEYWWSPQRIAMCVLGSTLGAFVLVVGIWAEAEYWTHRWFRNTWWDRPFKRRQR